VIVVADTSPLNYLIQIGCIDVLQKLYGRVLLPTGVLRELSHAGAPAAVRIWTKQIPPWIEIGPAVIPADITLAFLGLGEREAIQLAKEYHADLLLIDERKGSLEAQRRGIPTTGTLGVLLASAEFGFIDARHAYRLLVERTTFRTSPALETAFLTQASRRPRNNPARDLAPLSASGDGLPTSIVHCDWSMHKNRRWMAKAQLTNGRYLATAPELVGNLNDETSEEKPFLIRSHREGRRETTLIGFDFPIGLPKAYADRANIKNFTSFLKSLQVDAPFFKVCDHKDEISIKRPFYPNAPGGKRQEHLVETLGIDFNLLLRTCDHAQRNRNEASALFWTLGAKQVGKAAIVGWRDVLAPALRKKEIEIWPFQGNLETLLKPGKIVVAETYPAQYYSDIFGALEGAKRNQEIRRKVAQRILHWTEQRAEHLELSPGLREEILAGSNHGQDDAFDATIGLFGMIESILDVDRSSHEPSAWVIQNIEGWILGQPVR
jgi:predicted nucleic acid-binding protein